MSPSLVYSAAVYLNLSWDHDRVLPQSKGTLHLVDQGGEEHFNKLMLRVKNSRCEDSFRELFDIFFDKVSAFLQRGGIDSSQASEIAQETLLAVWHKSALYDPAKGTFKMWVFTIARNLKFDHMRSGQRDILNLSSENIFDHLEDSSFQQESLGLSEGVRRQIDLLPPEQKDAVEGMYYDGYSHAEYASLRKIPLGTVKSRIRLALAQLKKGME